MSVTISHTLQLVHGCVITANERNVAIATSRDGTVLIKPMSRRKRTPSAPRATDGASRQAENSRSREHKDKLKNGGSARGEE